MPNPARLAALSQLMQAAGSSTADRMKKRATPPPVPAAGPDALTNDALGEEGGPPDNGEGQSPWKTLQDAASTGDATAQRVSSVMSDGDGDEGVNGMQGEGDLSSQPVGESPMGMDPMEGEEALNEPDDMYGSWDADNSPEAMEAGGGSSEDGMGMRAPTSQTPGGEDPNEMGDDVEPEFDQYPGVKLPRKRY